MLSLSECIPWMTVGLAECVSIVTLNLCTIIVFISNRNLRKRSTYLMINLAVIDMFVGGVVGYYLFYIPGVHCNLWKRQSIEYETSIFIPDLRALLLYGSLINITSIALERVHATFLPVRHRVLKNWIYGLIIVVVWVTSGLISVSFVLLLLFEELQYAFYLEITFLSICLLIICVCYTSIIIKVRCGAQPQHHGAASGERKLTLTLLIVTVVSLLLYLPYVVFFSAIYTRESGLALSVAIHFFYTKFFYFTQTLL